MAGLHLGSFPSMFFYSWVPACPEKKRKEPAGSCFGQRMARKANSSGLPPKVHQVGGLPAGSRAGSTGAMDRVASAGHRLLGCGAVRYVGNRSSRPREAAV